jgi:hypothetical protein
MTASTGRKRDGRSSDSPDVKLSYRAQGHILGQFHREDKFVRGIIGPLGSGKTFGAINEMLRQAHDQTPNRKGIRKSRWCIARNSFPDLNSATIPDVREIVDQINPDGWNMTAPITWSHKYTRHGDGTSVEVQLMFRSFDGPQDVKKARGMQLTGVWVDELAEFDKSNFDMLVGRVKRYPSRADCPNAKFHILFTSNACAKDHWLADLALVHCPPNWFIGIQPGGVLRQGNSWVENPRAENIKNLPPSYYLDQLGGKKESWIRQNLANEFVVHSDGRPVHPDFNEQLHVSPCSPTPGRPLHIGMDFGRTPAAVIMQQQVDGSWLVTSELVTQNMGADRFGQLLKQHLNEHYAHYDIAEATGDPAGSQMTQARDETPFDMIRVSGIDATPAHTNDPEVRYSTLDNLLRQLIGGRPAVIIDPSCQVLIRGLGGEFQFRRLQVTGKELYTDKPDKGPTSHVCEALHYGLMGAGEGEALFDTAWTSEYNDVESWAPPGHHFE